jgi:ribosomal protein L32
MNKKLINIILTPFKMIWSIFDNDAHRIVSKKGLNLLQMENKLDKQLAKETTESLTEWMESKRELSECVNCDEVKQTHQICMDCIGKLIKENQETLYTEEDLRKAYFKGAADVHDKCTERTWRGVEVNVNIEKLKECNKQFMQSLKTKTK